MERPAGEESLELGAWAVRRRQGIYFVQKHSWQSREKGISDVNKNPFPVAAYNKLIQLYAGVPEPFAVFRKNNPCGLPLAAVAHEHTTGTSGKYSGIAVDFTNVQKRSGLVVS